MFLIYGLQILEIMIMILEEMIQMDKIFILVILILQLLAELNPQLPILFVNVVSLLTLIENALLLLGPLKYKLLVAVVDVLELPI